MIILKDIFVIFVAVEALLIMLLEMFGTQTKIARNAFDLPKKYLETRLTIKLRFLRSSGVCALISESVSSRSCFTLSSLISVFESASFFMEAPRFF